MYTNSHSRKPLSFTAVLRKYFKRGVCTAYGKPIHGKEHKRYIYKYARQFQDLGLNPYKCAVCGQGAIWNNKPLVLELHHINGNWNDNRISNLQMICGHCHSQTPTYKRRKS